MCVSFQEKVDDNLVGETYYDRLISLDENAATNVFDIHKLKRLRRFVIRTLTIDFLAVKLTLDEVAGLHFTKCRHVCHAMYPFRIATPGIGIDGNGL
jgi:hypothetical protein